MAEEHGTEDSLFQQQVKNLVADKTIDLAEWAGGWAAKGLPEPVRAQLERLHNDPSYQASLFLSLVRSGAMTLVSVKKTLIKFFGVSPEKASTIEHMVDDFVNHFLRKLEEHAGDMPAKKPNKEGASMNDVLLISYKEEKGGAVISMYHVDGPCPLRSRQEMYTWMEPSSQTRPKQNKGRDNRKKGDKPEMETVEIEVATKPTITRIPLMRAAKDVDVDSRGAKGCHRCGADVLLRDALHGTIKTDAKPAAAHAEAIESEARSENEEFDVFLNRLLRIALKSLPSGAHEATHSEFMECKMQIMPVGSLTVMQLLEMVASCTRPFGTKELLDLFQLPARPVAPVLITESEVEAFQEALKRLQARTTDPQKLLKLESNIQELRKNEDEQKKFLIFISEFAPWPETKIDALFGDDSVTEADRRKSIAQAVLTRDTAHSVDQWKYLEDTEKWNQALTARRLYRNKLMAEAATVDAARRQAEKDKEHAEHVAHEAKKVKEKEDAERSAQEFSQKYLGLTEAESRGDFSKTKSALPWG